MRNTPFSGSITALVTPFKDGMIDIHAFQDLVEDQLDEGTNGFVPCGTTGESPTLTDEEYALLTRLCLEVTESRAPVIAGCGSNDTAHAVLLARQAERLGADAALVVVPYYNKPSQEGLYLHFKTIHDKTALPIFVYDVPSRTGTSIGVETLARLAELPRIVGIKDATGDLARPVEVRRLCGPDFIQLSGNDDTALAFLAQGGQGCISVVSNVAPALCARMHAAWRNGDGLAAQKLNDQIQPLAKALFVESSPAPVKYALSLMGKCNNDLRLPMAPVNMASEKIIRDALKLSAIHEAVAA